MLQATPHIVALIPSVPGHRLTGSQSSKLVYQILQSTFPPRILTGPGACVHATSKRKEKTIRRADHPLVIGDNNQYKHMCFNPHVRHWGNHRLFGRSCRSVVCSLWVRTSTSTYTTSVSHGLDHVAKNQPKEKHRTQQRDRDTE